MSYREKFRDKNELPLKRFLLELPLSLHKRLKEYASSQEKSMRSVVIELLKQLPKK